MQPAEGIRFIHAAICREVREIEDQAAIADSPDEISILGDRVARFAQINKLHTDGEEDALYPELEQRARLVGAAYLYDHREEHALFNDLAERIAAAKAATAATRAGLLAKLRRQTIALTEHVIPHVNKEDALITPLLVELFSPAEQGAHIGRMMAKFPPDVMKSALPWLVASIEPDDRVAYLTMIKTAMPSERFAAACTWIRSGVAPDMWSAIIARVPGLPS